MKSSPKSEQGGNSSLHPARDVGREMEGIDIRDRADPETTGHWHESGTSSPSRRRDDVTP